MSPRIRIPKQVTSVMTTFIILLITFSHSKPVSAMSQNAKPVRKQVNAGLIMFLTEYRVVITGVVAFGVMTGLLAFIVLCMKLAANGDNPQARAEILKELMWVGVTTSLLGAFTMIVGMYYSIMING